MQGKDSTKSVTRQAVLYFSFAVLVIVLNLIIQKLHMDFLSPWICSQVSWQFVQTFYCPESGRVLVGSVLGVGVSYIVKFILDKFIVFQKRSRDLKQTSKEFIKYFLFAILTTLINIGGQYLLYWAFSIDYIIAGFISLAIGYIVKFLLDRKYVFPETTSQNHQTENPQPTSDQNKQVG
jgi:putative flippase GtrA